MLVFEGVSFNYRANAPVFEGLQYRLKPGALSVILGPNGVGKTTLLYLALGWLEPVRGLVQLDGRPLHKYTRAELGKRISLVPQEESIPYPFSVLEYVLFGRTAFLSVFGTPGKQDVQAARDSLARVGLSHLAARSINEISSGEKQMAVIARALAQEPKILLLDEPTSHLDLGNKYRLMQSLKALQQEGMTLLLTTHDPEIAFSYSDETVLVKGDGKVAVGSASAILTENILTELYKLPQGSVALGASRSNLRLL